MKKVTLLFPGQGSQYVGMGEKLFSSEYYRSFKTANSVLGHDLAKICQEGPEDKLTLTSNAQPGILTHSVALFQKLLPILNSKNIEIDSVLGHSVGEYSALVAAQVMSFEDAVLTVHYRGKYMQDAVPAGKGKMFAIMKLDPAVIENGCHEVSSGESRVMPANFNGPDQTVISGETSACERVIQWLESNAGTKFRAIELKVSAPFHSSLMAPAAEKLKQKLDALTFNSNKLPYIANIDAKRYGNGTSGEEIKYNLYRQVCGSVRWTQSVLQIPNETLCIEVGPSKVLTGLVKKIKSELTVIALDSDNGFEQLEEILK